MSQGVTDRMLQLAEQQGPGPNQQQALQALANAPQLAPQQLYGLSPEAIHAMGRQGLEAQQHANQVQQQALTRATQLDERAFDRLNTVNSNIRADRALKLNESVQGLQMSLAKSREGRDIESHTLEMERARMVGDQLRTKIDQEKAASEIQIGVPVMGADGRLSRKMLPAPIVRAAGIDVDTILRNDMAADQQLRTRLQPFTAQAFQESDAYMLSDPKNGLSATYDRSLKAIQGSKQRAKAGERIIPPEQRAWKQALAKFEPLMSEAGKVQLKNMLGLDPDQIGGFTQQRSGGASDADTQRLVDALINGVKSQRGE